MMRKFTLTLSRKSGRGDTLSRKQEKVADEDEPEIGGGARELRFKTAAVKRPALRALFKWMVAFRLPAARNARRSR